MDMGSYIIPALICLGLLYGLFRSLSTSEQGNGGWIGLVLLSILLAGLILSAQAHNEALTWLFGLALMKRPGFRGGRLV